MISEWVAPRPEPRVREYLRKLGPAGFFICQISIIEIERGVSAMTVSARKLQLEAWLTNTLKAEFADQILSVGDTVLNAALDLIELANKKRVATAFADTLIAACAAGHGLTLVTRNHRDFVKFDIPVINPWTGGRFNGA